MEMPEKMHDSCQGVSAGVWAKDQWELSLRGSWGHLLSRQLGVSHPYLVVDIPGFGVSQELFFGLFVFCILNSPTFIL